MDLKTGERLPHDRGDLLTKICGVDYNPEAPVPKWLAFLDKIFQGNTALIEFIQRASGYTATGSTREQAWFFLHGGGQNGKSTFKDTLHNVLGDYACTAEFESFTFKKLGHGVQSRLGSHEGRKIRSRQRKRTRPPIG